MKNGKFSNTPPLVENDITIEDPLQKSNIFNTFFASLSTVQNSDEFYFSRSDLGITSYTK